MTDNINITDADIASELDEREKLEYFLKENNEWLAARALEEKKKTKKQKRFELEQRFIGRLISESNEMGDIRELISKLSDDYNISWRQFIDKRHKVIWRALETMNLLSIAERKKIIEKEAYADPQTYNKMLDAPEDDLVRGIPGSAADKQFSKKLQEKSSKAIIWFEKELEATDALAIAGGKVYLRELAEIGDKELSNLDDLAKMMKKK